TPTQQINNSPAPLVVSNVLMYKQRTQAFCCLITLLSIENCRFSMQSNILKTLIVLPKMSFQTGRGRQLFGI
ncbi:MAG: hypothetical protein LBN93_08450, partial [Candidatus Symbiothrix sp.]|nr:hypothetical protein [Candidatus Symbiothrix sp.]